MNQCSTIVTSYKLDCGRECQTTAWPTHKTQCKEIVATKKREAIEAAKVIAREVEANKIAEDEKEEQEALAKKIAKAIKKTSIERECAQCKRSTVDPDVKLNKCSVCELAYCKCLINSVYVTIECICLLF